LGRAPRRQGRQAHRQRVRELVLRAGREGGQRMRLQPPGQRVLAERGQHHAQAARHGSEENHLRIASRYRHQSRSFASCRKGEDAMPEFVTAADGVELAYERQGEGPPLCWCMVSAPAACRTEIDRLVWRIDQCGFFHRGDGLPGAWRQR